METKDTLSSCSYSDEQDMQKMLKHAKDLGKVGCLIGLRFKNAQFKKLKLLDAISETKQKGVRMKIRQQRIRSDRKKPLDASLVNTESIGTESKEQDTSSRSGNDAHADDADIRPTYDEEPMVEDPKKDNRSSIKKDFRCPSEKILTPRLVSWGNVQGLKFSRQLVLGGFQLERYSLPAQPRLTVNPKMVQMRISLTNMNANKLLMSVQDSYKDGDGDASFQLKFDSLPHAHAQTTKTYYKHQDSRIKKAQVLKTKTSLKSNKQDLPLRYQVYQGRLLASFQKDAKYEHVGQDTRSQGGKDDED
ncbi:hypothetical protein Tco_0281899 [Tanacetum coccineum]